MTVQELIQILNAVEDKNRIVIVREYDGEYEEADEVREEIYYDGVPAIYIV